MQDSHVHDLKDEEFFSFHATACPPLAFEVCQDEGGSFPRTSREHSTFRSSATYQQASTGKKRVGEASPGKKLFYG